MSSNSDIQWTNHTFNPWWGCTKVHSGCTNCYAETLDKRFGPSHWGNNPRRMVLGEWGKPAKWNAQAADLGVKARVFCASMCDLFEDYQGPVVDQQGKELEWTVDRLRRRVFEMIEKTPWLEWQLLTKRPENVTRMVPSEWLDQWPTNALTGTSPCNQETADKCIKDLAQVPGRRFLSCEPLVGPIDISLPLHIGWIDWVIVGGESGNNSRPCDIDWIRRVVTDCKAEGVPVFVKQLGSKPRELNKRGRAHVSLMPFEWDDGGENIERWYKPRDKKGGDPSEWPEDLRVRQFPEVKP
jgi:protein gp37